MAGTISLAGTVGPGITVPGFTTISEVTGIYIDMEKNLVVMYKGSQAMQTISVVAATILTGSKSGSTWTLTIG